MASLLVASSTSIRRRACTAFVAAVGMAFHSSAAFSTTASASAAKRVSLFQHQEYYEYYEKTYKPIHSEEETKFLRALAKTPLVEEKLSDTLVAYSFEERLPMEQETHAPNVLYARNFYPRLLGKIRGFRKAVLIGNPGTGKSVFQFYHLMSLLHPQKFPDAFPPNKKDDIPKVVIRECGDGPMSIFYLDELEVEEVRKGDELLLKLFNPRKALYLYEPGKVVREPHHSPSLHLPIFTTVSPDRRRYKEFTKKGGIEFYQPTWSLADLKAMGKHMKAQPTFPEDTNPLFKPDLIEERFGAFGGITTQVLPHSQRSLRQSLKDRTNKQNIK